MTGVKPTELLLIDGDTLVYRYALMNQGNLDVAFPPLEYDGELVTVDPLEAAQLAFQQKLQFLLEDTGVPDLRIALAKPGSLCFRYEFFPKYKSHRPPPPDIIGQMRSWVREVYADKLLPYVDHAETDDILGLNHRPDGTTCIVSIDKDFYTLPGWNYHPFTGALRWISPAMAKATFWYQVLVGDSADGFPGCRGIGKVKAERIILKAIAEGADLRDVVLKTYESQGHVNALRDCEITRCLVNVSGTMDTPQYI